MTMNAISNTTKEVRKVVPLVDIHETEKDVLLKAEMPGLDRENITLELIGDELSIRGARRDEQVPEGYRPVHRERVPYEYARKFVLGADVERGGITAEYRDGVLFVKLLKTEEQQPKRIAIGG